MYIGSWLPAFVIVVCMSWNTTPSHEFYTGRYKKNQQQKQPPHSYPKNPYKTKTTKNNTTLPPPKKKSCNGQTRFRATGSIGLRTSDLTNLIKFHHYPQIWYGIHIRIPERKNTRTCGHVTGINIDNISITIAESYWTIIYRFVYIF